MVLERLQKILAHAGVASRRAAEELILDGRVRVNGKTIRTLGAKADSWRDKIEVDNRQVLVEKPVYYIFHKPRGVVTTLEDPEKRPSIADYLGEIPERIYPVGRLDFNTSGVLLITNDGAMTQALLHPRRKVPKKYLVKFRGELLIDELDALRNGVMLDNGEKTGKSELFVRRQERGYTWVEITIFEGKNRQIHRMGEAIGRPVSHLSRIAFAGLTTDELRPGQYRKLKTKEVEKLKRHFLNPARRSKHRESKT
jgi:23S rRNA pseudouridine2605 synthase